MSTPEHTTFAKTPHVPGRFRLPDPPEDPESKMTSFDHLTINGNAHYLAQHLGNPHTTLVAGDRYLVVRPTRSLAGSRYPDLLVAFDVDPAAYKASNGYIISDQGKPPDWVMEVASRSTGEIDVGEKRGDYAALGIGEYWRFDETGEHHGAKLAGDRLVDGEYVALDIEELPDGPACKDTATLADERARADGPAPALGRWPRVGPFYDLRPRAAHIATLADERAAVPIHRRSRTRIAEREARAAEREARNAAEARVRELEEQVRRQDPYR